MNPCEHCGELIEPVDNTNATKYRHRHSESKRISCFGVYQPEIATPVTEGLSA